MEEKGGVKKGLFFPRDVIQTRSESPKNRDKGSRSTNGTEPALYEAR